MGEVSVDPDQTPHICGVCSGPVLSVQASSLYTNTEITEIYFLMHLFNFYSLMMKLFGAKLQSIVLNNFNRKFV